MDARLRRNATTSDRIVAALTSPELIALVTFCALGLLVTVALTLAVANFGETTASLQPFL